MIAFDTNLLVRAVINDNPAQTAVVQRLIEQNNIFISRTVLLETEWVLRSAYKKSSMDILSFFRALLEIDNTFIEDASVISYALDWYALGADFADALHLSVCDNRIMYTFDKNFCKKARKEKMTPLVKVIEIK